MIENSIFETASSANSDGEALRIIEWGELSARLGAARELRALMRQHSSRRPDRDTASFACLAMRRPLSSSAADKSNRCVNLNASIDGKQYVAQASDAARIDTLRANSRDREFV